MAAIVKRVKEYDNPEKSGQLVEFYLGYQNGMERGKQYSTTITVNGYPFTAYFGRTNILPKDVVRVLQNSKSAMHPTPNVGRIDTAIGGQGRPQNEIMQSVSQDQYIPDYEIVIQKEV